MHKLKQLEKEVYELKSVVQKMVEMYEKLLKALEQSCHQERENGDSD